MAVFSNDVGSVLSGSRPVTRQGRSWWRRHFSLTLGLLLTGLPILLAIFASQLTAYDPSAQDLLHTLAPPFSSGHVLGTDQFGRDIFSRILYSARIDVLIAFGATSVAFFVGTVVGLLAGYYGRWFDAIIMRIVDIFFAFPFLVLVLVIIAILGPGLLNMFIAIWLTNWIPYVRIVRAEVLSLKQSDFILAARALGFSGPRIMFSHLLPNAISSAIIFAMLNAVYNVGLGAFLGYLGLGVQDPLVEWGKMIADGQNFMLTNWWLTTLPGLAVVIFGLGLSLVGDGLAVLLRPSD